MSQKILIKENKKLTYKQYFTIKDDKRYELIEGKLLMSPAPNTKHQRIIRKLLRLIENCLINKKIKGEVFLSPIDVVFREDIVLQPDIVYITEERKDIIKERGIFGIPDLVIEVISPGSEKRDIVDKKRIYEESKVKEYWIVFPNEEFIEVLEYDEKGNRYKEIGVYNKEKELESKVIKGLKIKVKEVFEI
ncbi:MAG: hypothetical protein KatS3mg129_1834 [Leptospiraceae bacterium]|nr:MAG: hypothetical protein KatS3mg129_1834 [Leptospiraceae bacterium]